MKGLSEILLKVPHNVLARTYSSSISLDEVILRCLNASEVTNILGIMAIFTPSRLHRNGVEADLAASTMHRLISPVQLRIRTRLLFSSHRTSPCSICSVLPYRSYVTFARLTVRFYSSVYLP